MGYMLKTIFWLGLVYSAMPFDERPKSVTAASGEWLCRSALSADAGAPEAYRQALAAGCVATLAEPRSAPSTPAAAPGFALTDEDRRAPWAGATAKPTKRKPKSG